MAPFLEPKLAIHGFKDKVESITVQGDRLYIGTTTGNIHIYAVDDQPSDDGETATLVETKKGLARRAIDQLGFIKDINSLVVLSESVVTLYPIPTFSPSTVLTKAKGVFSFAIHTSVQHVSPDGKPVVEGVERTNTAPTLVTYLAVGCRRKMVIYSWRDGEAQEIKEAVLPHSPRLMAFFGNDAIALGYERNEYAIFSLSTLTASDIVLPVSGATSVPGVSTLSGLTSYMTLGLGAKARPCVSRINEKEVLVSRDNDGIFYGPDGKQTRAATIDWPAPPEETAYVKSYILSIMPSGTVPAPAISDVASILSSSTSQASFVPFPVVQINSTISHLPVQSIPSSFATANLPPGQHPHAIRLLTPSDPTCKSPVYLVTTPTDRSAAAQAEGSSIWTLHMKPWGQQIDELIDAGCYADALALLKEIEAPLLSDKNERQAKVRALHAVSLFREGKYDDAANTFIDLDINPAKVIALYPESIAGRLSVPQDEWVPLFGGPSKPAEEQQSETEKTAPSDAGDSQDKDDSVSAHSRPSTPDKDRLASPVGSMRDRLRNAFIPSGPKDDDTASIRSGRSTMRRPHRPDSFHRSVETLLRYLSDRRPKVAGALAAVHITPSQAHKLSPLSEATRDELFAQPNASLTSLTPEQLLRYAQIVDTALFKSYLVIRPGLLGPLCRIENWCEVEEVEEVLQAREKFAELIYLYNGKKMHAKALALLRRLSDNETDMRDKLSPSISYLQRLGPEHLEQIFESSRWLFEQDSDMAFEIFTSEDVELPYKPVADYLEDMDPKICARYLEFLIRERGLEDPQFHNRLAQIYLNISLSAKKEGQEELYHEWYNKLLDFIDTTNHYHVDRLFGALPMEDLFEARAILLGRLGRHEHALEIYVYRLQDHRKAEAYCKRVYRLGSETSQVFLSLLKIYLRPTVKVSSDLLSPALDLISRHSPRIDATEVLQLLPPLVTAQGVRTFLIEALRAPIFDTHVVREISKARSEQVARKLVTLESKRVRVTDSRICPQCHKRIGGNSVIAVHSPRGEVTHYQCREAFSKRLNETRR